jgi:hypothetical protein
MTQELIARELTLINFFMSSGSLEGTLKALTATFCGGIYDNQSNLLKENQLIKRTSLPFRVMESNSHIQMLPNPP